MTAKLIYLDHAATSWPKPPEVIRAMNAFLEQAGSNPGRSAHRLSVAAGRIVYAAREAVALLFHAPDPMRVVFTCNATGALNLALRGLLRSGDHVVTSGMEHNSVMRPLRALERQGVNMTVTPCALDGTLDPGAVRQTVTARTRLIAVTHARNVTGTLLPVAELAAIAREAGALLLVDAAQTAGVVPIDLDALGIDLLAFTGHKALHGPPGTGGLIIGPRVDIARFEPLTRGGTGSRSESQEQPELLPDKYESGTANGVGLAGLGAGVQWVRAQGVEALREKEVQLSAALREGLNSLPGVTVHGPQDPRRAVAVVSFTVKGREVSTIGERLDEEFGVLCRVGLHCAPAAHQTIGTFPAGTVRFAPGPLTTPDEIRAALDAVKKVIATS